MYSFTRGLVSLCATLFLTLFFSCHLGAKQYSSAVGGGQSGTGDSTPGQVGSTRVIVDSAPTGAKVFLDNNFIGKTPVRTQLPKAKYSLKVKKKGYEVYKDVIRIRSGERQRFDITLVKQKRSGKVVIDSIPIGAKIYIGKKLYGKTPLSLELVEREYQLKIVKKRFDTHRETIRVKYGKTKRIKVRLKKPKRYGKLEIDTTPTGAKLFLNDVFYQKTPALIPLEVGKYSLRLEKKGYNSLADTVVIRHQERLKFNVKLVPQQYFGKVVVGSHPSGARIYINDRYYDVTPARIKLRQGEYRIKVEKDNYHSSTQQVTVRKKKESHLFFDLKPVEVFGTLVITSLPARSKVFINEQFYDKTPLTVRLLAGEHSIMLKKRGYQSHVDRVTIIGGENTVRQYRLRGNVITPPPVGTLRIRSTPQGARITVNDEFYGLTPVDIDLVSGRHRIAVEADGFRTYEEDIILGVGELKPVWVELEEIAREKRYGQLNITAGKRAKVFIDGRYRGDTPLSVRLTEGDHYVQLNRRHHEIFSDLIHIAAWQVYEVDVDLVWNGLSDIKRNQGVVEILSQPLGGKVFINNQYHGSTPETLTLKQGVYSLEIWHKGYHPFTRQLRVEPGENIPIRAQLRWRGYENPAFIFHEILKDVMKVE